MDSGASGLTRAVVGDDGQLAAVADVERVRPWSSDAAAQRTQTAAAAWRMKSATACGWTPVGQSPLVRSRRTTDHLLIPETQDDHDLRTVLGL